MLAKTIKNLKYLSKYRTFPFSSNPNFNQVEIIYSSIQNIHFNLATEEYLFDFSNLNHPILFLWRNDKTVVIGIPSN